MGWWASPFHFPSPSSFSLFQLRNPNRASNPLSGIRVSGLPPPAKVQSRLNQGSQTEKFFPRRFRRHKYGTAKPSPKSSKLFLTQDYCPACPNMCIHTGTSFHFNSLLLHSSPRSRFLLNENGGLKQVPTCRYYSDLIKSGLTGLDRARRSQSTHARRDWVLSSIDRFWFYAMCSTPYVPWDRIACRTVPCRDLWHTIQILVCQHKQPKVVVFRWSSTGHFFTKLTFLFCF